MKKADHLMELAVEEHVFPGGVLLVSEKGKIVFHKAYGKASIYSGLPVGQHTVFDLASLTKPLATTLAVMKLIEEDILHLKDTIGETLPEFKGTSKEGITVCQLLNHTSGFPDYQPYYQELIALSVNERRKALKERLVNEKRIHSPGKTTVYSDLGFMVLGWLVEAVSGHRLDSFLGEKIYSRMGLTSLFFIPIHDEKIESETGNWEFAATEKCPWRGKIIEGVVHDDNAFATGGVEGHAGLFGTAEDVHRLLEDLLKTFNGKTGSGVVKREILHTFFKMPDKKNERPLGFDVPAPRDSSSGRYFSDNTVGHLGFTGTSFWMDLARSIIVILLTNRIHPDRKNEKIKLFRPRLHDAVMQQLTSQ